MISKSKLTIDNEIAELLWVNWATSHRHTICVSSHVDYLRFYYSYSRRFQTKQRDILKTIFHQHTFMNAVWPLVVLLPNLKATLLPQCGGCGNELEAVKAVHHASIAAKVKRPSSVLAQMNLRSPHLDQRLQQLLLPNITLRSSARPRHPLLHPQQRARPSRAKT